MEAPALDRTAKTFPLGLAAAGFISALISVPFKGREMLLSAAIFGTMVGLYLGVFGDLRSFARFIAFIMICIIAYPLSWLIVGFSHAGGDSLYVTLPQFFVGGGAGAFFVLLAGMLLFGPPEMLGDSLGLAFVGALGGAILGVLGGALDRKIGTPKPGDFGACVYFVWQSGVALMLGLLLRWGQKQYLSASQSTT
jgi:hypothetical protein